MTSAASAGRWSGGPCTCWPAARAARTGKASNNNGHQQAAGASKPPPSPSVTNVTRFWATEIPLKHGELAQIGVPLGDRKRLLKAIASLCKIEPSSSSRESTAPAEANLPVTPTPAHLAAGRDAERRPLTVMFCDLVDSTALASR